MDPRYSATWRIRAVTTGANWRPARLLVTDSHVAQLGFMIQNRGCGIWSEGSGQFEWHYIDNVVWDNADRKPSRLLHISIFRNA
jgi:hypothetical protein